MTTKPKIELPDRPDLTLTLSNERKVKMSYGLEMDLRRMLPDAGTALQLLMSDPLTQDYIVRRCLTDKNYLIVDEKELVAEVELDSEEVERLLMWVGDHALYFFTKRALAITKLGEKYEAVLQKPSTTGSTDSASQTQSAGPSE